MDRPDNDPDSFEATYPRFPFAELVRLGIALARRLRRLEPRLRHLRRRAGRGGETAARAVTAVTDMRVPSGGE